MTRSRPLPAGWESPYAFSADGQILLGQTGASTLKIFDLAKDREAGSRKLKETVGNSALSPDGRLFASGDPFGKLQWGAIQGPGDLRTARPDGESIGAMALSVDGRTFAAGAGRKIRLLNTATGEVRLMLPGHRNALVEA